MNDYEYLNNVREEIDTAVREYGSHDVSDPGGETLKLLAALGRKLTKRANELYKRAYK